MGIEKIVIPIFRGIEIGFALIAVILCVVCAGPVGLIGDDDIRDKVVWKDMTSGERKYLDCLKPDFAAGTPLMHLVVGALVIFMLTNIVFLIFVFVNLYEKWPVLYLVGGIYALVQAVFYLTCVVCLVIYFNSSATFKGTVPLWYEVYYEPVAKIDHMRYASNWKIAAGFVGFSILVCIGDAGFHFYMKKKASESALGG